MKPITRLGLIARPHPSALAALVEAAEWLTTHGATVVLAEDEAAAAATELNTLAADLRSSIAQFKTADSND